MGDEQEQDQQQQDQGGEQTGGDAGGSGESAPTTEVNTGGGDATVNQGDQPGE